MQRKKSQEKLIFPAEDEYDLYLNNLHLYVYIMKGEEGWKALKITTTLSITSIFFCGLL